MKCSRCCGLMVADSFLDLQESYVPMWTRVVRCITCGNVEDPLIHHHRGVQQAKRAQSAESYSVLALVPPKAA